MDRFLAEAKQKQSYIFMPFHDFMEIIIYKLRYFLTDGFGFKEGNSGC